MSYFTSLRGVFGSKLISSVLKQNNKPTLLKLPERHKLPSNSNLSTTGRELKETLCGNRLLNATLMPKLFLSKHAPFSTFSANRAKKDDKCNVNASDFAMPGSEGIISAEVCEGVKKTGYTKVVCPAMPPCLRYVRPPGQVQPISPSKIDCGRICMPCCPKARYPPVCFFPTTKKPCCKVANPRPAFSECEKDCVNRRPICDCCHIKPPPCRLLPDVENSC